jgi:hypothetical protein
VAGDWQRARAFLRGAGLLYNRGMKLYTLEMLAIAFIPALLVGGAFLVALVYLVTWLWRL